MDLPTRLARRIAATGLKKAEIARRAGVSPARLGNYLNGTRTPDLATLERIAAVLGTDADQMNGAAHTLTTNLGAILAKLFQMNGLDADHGKLMAEVAVAALQVVRSLPDEGDADLQSRMAAEIAWRSRTAPTRGQ